MNVDITKTTQTIISYCTGIRGIERGLERAGVDLRIATFLEIEAFICENLVHAMEQGLLAPAPIWSNLKTFEPEPFRGLVDGFIGGYPCQPFSNAGKRKGTEDPRHLWPYICEHIRVIRPFWCFFENVSGHLTLGFDEVYRNLSDLGYKVEVGIYTAQEAGAPHKRERLFILAVDNTNSKSNRNNERRIHPETSSTNKELEHTKSSDGFDVRRQKSRKEKKSISGNTSDEIIYNPIKQGLERGSKQGKDAGEIRRRQKGTHGSIGQFCGFPARPGQQQYDWEEPRAVKSGLGCTINGYNFREDFLRALGNSVVEHTAEIAFKDLMKKHGIET